MAFDEMSGDGGGVRDSYRGLARWLAEAPEGLLQARSRQAELFFRRMGITFAVYGDAESSERLIPFDVVPRIIGAAEWSGLEAGLVQRVRAINLFLADVYGPQDCLKAGVIPADLVLTNPHYVPEMQGRRPPRGVWVQIAGVDLVRTGEDEFYVLEDNCRTPSGVSYMLENREMMMRLFPDLFADYPVRPVETYADMLLASLRACAPEAAGADPTIVVLTPGPFNSAYYEHSFLADKLGVDLVEGRDLFVDDGKVFMRTTQGRQQVDVVYRRIDDDFLDPLTFRPDSSLGVPGLMTAYQAVTVTLGVPTIWLNLLAYLRQSGKRLDHLKNLVSGGSAAPVAMLKAYEKEYGVNVLQGWGMTETSPVCSGGSYSLGIENLDEDALYRRNLVSGLAEPD